MSFVSEIEPRALWTHFDRILEIPRASKKEDGMREYILGLARELGLESKTDAVGNVVVYKPGTAGHETAPGTVLQSHLDMVQEKNSDTEHDFDKDPIRPVRDGEYLKADGTTLGSDNGIGVAAMLAVMHETDLAHGPLELLFTVDEETGLTGAAGLAGDLLTGRRLINCDSEEEGVLTIGCAGGADTHLYLDLTHTPVPTGHQAIGLRLFGLKGGHSGIDIHLQRGNAVKLMVRALCRASEGRTIRVATLEGGNAHNAIPREATASIVVPEKGIFATIQALQTELAAIREEYRPAEPGMEFDVSPTDAPGQAWDEATSARVLALLNGLPHGVVAMSYAIPGLVETSTNVAMVGGKKKRCEVLISCRSSVASALTALQRRITSIATPAGAEIEHFGGYPGWKPDVDSAMLELTKKAHLDVLGREPEVGAVHAGLECGIIGEKYPGMDMISFGPQIEFPHSPDERVKVDTVGTFYRLLKTTLERLA